MLPLKNFATKNEVASINKTFEKFGGLLHR
jgi:hypothetical protein